MHELFHRVQPGLGLLLRSRTTVISTPLRGGTGSNWSGGRRLEGYEAEMDRVFGRSKDHAAVRLAGELRERHGIGFYAVVSFALSATLPPSLAERVPFGPNGKGWPTSDGTDRTPPCSSTP